MDRDQQDKRAALRPQADQTEVSHPLAAAEGPGGALPCGNGLNHWSQLFGNRFWVKRGKNP